MKIVSVLICLLFTASHLCAQEAPEGLFIGSKAQDFKAKDQNGKTVQLKELLKKGKVVGLLRMHDIIQARF